MPQRQPYCPKQPDYGCAVGIAKLLASNETLIRWQLKIRREHDEDKKAELIEGYMRDVALYPAKCGACRFSKHSVRSEELQEA